MITEDNRSRRAREGMITEAEGMITEAEGMITEARGAESLTHSVMSTYGQPEKRGEHSH
jgi:hypothetical protein